jgi:NTE family protein
MAHRNHPKVGLALGSGGAKGLAHIGVLKTLEKHNVPIDFIAGSSIGALMGAHYAAFKDTKRLEEFFIGLQMQRGLQLFDPILKGGLIKGKKFEKFIEDLIEGAAFDKLQIPFAAVATDFTNARTIIFTQGNLTKAIRASTSVPTLFQPLNYKDRILADGGLSNSVPVDVAKIMGADIVIAVNLDTVYLEQGLLPALSKTPLHSINILRHNLALQSTKTADVIISPHGISQIGIIGWDYFFNTGKTKQVIEAGEKAAEKMLPEIMHLLTKKQKRKNHINHFFNFIKRYIKKN